MSQRRRLILVCLLAIFALGMEQPKAETNPRNPAATSPAKLDSPAANSIWAKKYSEFLGELSQVSARDSEYDDRPSILLTLSDVITCVSEPVFFEVHFTSLGRFVTQFRVGEEYAPSSVRKINESFRKSEPGSQEELESAKVLRAQYYLSRIAALVDDGERAMERAVRYRQELSQLCSSDELITAFIDRVKPQVAPRMREIPKVEDQGSESSPE